MSTLPELSFNWSQPCGEMPEDSMGRAEHAKNLTNFLIQKGQEGSYVLNLNAKWGTGKSYFLRRWENEIEHAYPAVYIDAWSSDHSGNPLLSVVSAIKTKLHELHDINGFEAKLFEGVAKAVKAAAPAVVRALIKGQLKRTGINLDDLGEVFSNEDAADAGAKLVEQAINAHEEATVGVANIKASIRGWLASVIKTGARQYPLFIFIDELDRCRPTYAIEMLETIKHIFDMQNVVFIVATDKDQLQHSIRAIYGVDFDSRLYLDRFFTRTVTLSNPSRLEFITRKIKSSPTFSAFIKEDDNFAFLPSGEGREHDMVTLLASIADGFSWPLRSVNLWLDRIEAALIMSSTRLEIIMLSFMMALETSNSEWLKKLDDGHSVFSQKQKKIHEDLDFKHMEMTIPWSFNQVKFSIKDETMQLLGHKAEIINHAKSSIVNFITLHIERLNDDKALIYEGMKKEIEDVAYGRQTSHDFLFSMDEGDSFPDAASFIYAIFHFKNGTTLSNYIELCRFSSLMS